MRFRQYRLCRSAHSSRPQVHVRCGTCCSRRTLASCSSLLRVSSSFCLGAAATPTMNMGLSLLALNWVAQSDCVQGASDPPCPCPGVMLQGGPVLPHIPSGFGFGSGLGRSLWFRTHLGYELTPGAPRHPFSYPRPPVCPSAGLSCARHARTEMRHEPSLTCPTPAYAPFGIFWFLAGSLCVKAHILFYRCTNPSRRI